MRTIAGLAVTVGTIALTPITVTSADPQLSCGAHEDAFACSARNQTGPPTPGESAFINLVRGHVPGSDQQLLVTGRTICNELAGGISMRYLNGQVAAHLGMTSSADQVVVAAVEYICPGVPQRP
jgi:hypothetical protein